MSRGQFRLALRLAQKLDELWPDQPAIVRAIALMSTVMNYRDEASTAWQRYARLPDIPYDRRVEAEMLAMQVRSKVATPTFDVKETIYEVSDLGAAFERIQALPQTQTQPEDYPAPDHGASTVRYGLQLGDRPVEPLDDDADGYAALLLGNIYLLEDLGGPTCQVAVFGPETDSMVAARAELERVLGDLVVGEPETKHDGMISQEAWWLRPSLILHPGRVRQAYDRQWRLRFERHLTENWAHLALDDLEGKTPHEAANEERWHPVIDAKLASLKDSASFFRGAFPVIDRFRQTLGLPAPPQYSADQFEEVAGSASMAVCLDMTALSDDQLSDLQSRARYVESLPLLMAVTQEIIRRDIEGVDGCEQMFTMAQVDPDLDRVEEHLARARHLALQQGDSLGLVLVHEVEIRLSRGMVRKVPDLIGEIARRFHNDPAVMMKLRTVLENQGIHPDRFQNERSAGRDSSEERERDEAASAASTQPTAAPHGPTSTEPSDSTQT